MKDMDHQKNIAIVLSAGQGNRMNSDIPKQYMDLCGMPVIAWSLKAFQEFDAVDEVILVTSAEDIEYCRNDIIDKYRFDKVKKIVPGGAERYLSVWEGLKAARDAEGILPETGRVRNDADPEPIIFIHDGARPMIDRPVLERTLEGAETYRACVAGMPVKDTIKIADKEGFAVRTPNRRLVWQIQTPQVFSFSLVYGAYRRLIEAGITDVTDDAMVVERMADTRVKLVEGSYRNLKITTREDIEIARYMLS